MAHGGLLAPDLLFLTAYIGPGVGNRASPWYASTWYGNVARSFGMSVDQLVLASGIFVLLGVAVLFAALVFGSSFPGRADSRAARGSEEVVRFARGRRPLKPGGYI